MCESLLGWCLWGAEWKCVERGLKSSGGGGGRARWVGQRTASRGRRPLGCGVVKLDWNLVSDLNVCCRRGGQMQSGACVGGSCHLEALIDARCGLVRGYAVVGGYLRARNKSHILVIELVIAGIDCVGHRWGGVRGGGGW